MIVGCHDDYFHFKMISVLLNSIYTRIIAINFVFIPFLHNSEIAIAAKSEYS